MQCLNEVKIISLTADGFEYRHFSHKKDFFFSLNKKKIVPEPAHTQDFKGSVPFGYNNC